MALKRTHKIAAAGLIAAAALSGCTKVTSGKAEVADLSKGYTGPPMSTAAPVNTPLITPGVELSIGVGKNKVTCTAGWLIKRGDTFGVLTAGQCARAGVGAPVSYMWDHHGTDKLTQLGTVSDTTFKDPYNHSELDLAVISIKTTSENSATDVDPRIDPMYQPVPHAIGAPGVGSAKELAAKDKGGQVCWYSGVTGDKTPKDIRHCGTITAGGYDKVMVKPDSPDDYAPIMEGAPAVWNAPSGKVYPVGVVTDFYKDQVVVDTIGEALSKANADIYLG